MNDKVLLKYFKYFKYYKGNTNLHSLKFTTKSTDFMGYFCKLYKIPLFSHSSTKFYSY